MYRLIVESLLGLRLEGGQLRFVPVLPHDWDGFSMSYRHRDTWYRIELRQSAAGTPRALWLDGVEQPGCRIPLHDDGIEHSVQLNHPRGGAEPDAADREIGAGPA